MPSVLTSNVVQGIAFVLFLVALPLISFGTTEGQEALWWIGLALIVIAGILPPLTRFVPLADDEDEDEEEADEEGDAGEEGDAEKEETT
jgi:predicted cobalt transporter CbtA